MPFIKGSELRRGDRITVWLSRLTIEGLSPYKGPLEKTFAQHGGARLATFVTDSNKRYPLRGMTIINNDMYEVHEPHPSG
jgi:hypothetical protein